MTTEQVSKSSTSINCCGQFMSRANEAVRFAGQVHRHEAENTEGTETSTTADTEDDTRKVKNEKGTLYMFMDEMITHSRIFLVARAL